MKETSIRILLAEYDRLKDSQQNLLQSYDGALQLYLMVITAAAGAFLLLLERQMELSALRLNVGSLLAAVLLIGEITYLRLMGLDVGLAQNAKAYLLIRDKFIQEDPELTNAFPKGLLQDTKRYRSWSSIGGIIHRAGRVSQQKTTAVFLNCLVSAGVAIIAVWPKTVWIGSLVGMGTAVLVGFLHVVHASWRYEMATKQLATGEVEFWI